MRTSNKPDTKTPEVTKEPEVTAADENQTAPAETTAPATETPIIDWANIKAEKASKFPSLTDLDGKQIRIHKLGTEQKGRDSESTYKLGWITLHPDTNSENGKWYELPTSYFTKIGAASARAGRPVIVDAKVAKQKKRTILIGMNE